MWAILALGVFETVVNRLIDLDPISRHQLNGLKGHLLRVMVEHPYLSVDVLFDQDKVHLEATPTKQAQRPSLFEQRPFDPKSHPTTATTTLQVATLTELISALLTQSSHALNVTGDAGLLLQIQRITSQTQLDLAAKLSPWVGANLSHEIARLQQLPKQLKNSGKSLAFFVEDTLKQDLALFADRSDFTLLQQQQRQLEQALSQLEQRLHQLQPSSQQNATQTHEVLQ